MTPLQRQAVGVHADLNLSVSRTLRRVAIGALIAATSVLQGATIVWLGGVGNFENTLLWVGGRLPGTSDNIVIGGLLTPSTVTINSNARVRNITIGAGDSLIVANGKSVELTGSNVGGGIQAGSVVNNGTLRLNASSNLTALTFKNGTFTFSGTGSLTLSNSLNNQIYGISATDELVNSASHTIQGSGQLGVNLLKITNQGLILANQGNNLIIDPNAGGVTNTGTLRASNGATLDLRDGSFTNAGGLIRADDSSRVNLNSVTITGGTLTSAGTGRFLALGNTSLTALTLTSGTQVDIVSGQQLNLAGTIVNAGSIELLPSSTGTYLVAAAGGTTLTGGGNIVLSNSTQNVIRGATGVTTLVNLDNVISGAGQLGANQLQLDNRHIIDANIAGATLAIDPSGTGASNAGTMRATNGGTLRLIGGTFNNTGTISASGTDSHVDFDGTILTGGTLTTTLGASIRNLNTATLTNVSLAALVDLQNGSTTNFIGTVANSGTINLQSSGSPTNLIVGIGGMTLSGGGEILLTNNNTHQISGVTGATTLTNVDNTIRGSGQLGSNQLTLVNTGTIEANQSTPLTVNLSGATPFNNQGTLRATNGASLIFVDNFSNAGAIVVQSGSTLNAQGTLTQTAGSISLQTGTLTTAGATVQNGSGLQGAGTINGAFANSGLIAPGAGGTGAGIGTLTFNQTLTLTNTSLLHFELGGATSFDQVRAQNAFLAGSVAVSFINGFQSTVTSGQSFTLLSTTNANGLTGTFAGVANGGWLVTADGANRFQVTYTTNSFTLSNFQAIPEPSTYLLLLCGSAALWRFHRRRR